MPQRQIAQEGLAIAAEFISAPDVEDIARELIEKYHGHLAGARIAYRSRVSVVPEGSRSKTAPSWRSRGHLLYGRTMRVSGPVRELTGEDGEQVDFLVLVNGDVWNALSDDQKHAVVDHELSHCGENEAGNWAIEAHDVEEFGPVVARWGLWREEVRAFDAALQDAPGVRQMRMDLSQVDDGADEDDGQAEDAAEGDGAEDPLPFADERPSNVTPMRRRERAVRA